MTIHPCHLGLSVLAGTCTACPVQGSMIQEHLANHKADSDAKTTGLGGRVGTQSCCFGTQCYVWRAGALSLKAHCS